MTYIEFIWDLDDDPAGNVEHIAEHGVTPDEVEEVIRDPRSREDRSRSTDFPITFGWTSAGRFLAVVWEMVNDDPRVIKPITAYPAHPPRGRR